MRKLLLLLLLVPVICFGQSEETKQKIKNMEESGLFSIDGNNIVASRVIEDIPGTKDEIYSKVKNYFARTYKNSKSVLQTDDKESGVVIGRGYYSDFYGTTFMISSVYFSAYHILRIDIKDGRVRVVCSVSEMITAADTKGTSRSDYLITEYAPITDKRKFDKGKQSEALIQLVALMNATIDSVEKSLKEGSLSIEKEDW